MSGQQRSTEFGLIERYFAPLSKVEPGGYNLTDDAASLVPAEGCETIVTKDMMASGVHFFADDPPESLGRKLLRVNLSDLAAMGAVPRAYLLGMALPDETSSNWLEAFAGGLAQDQEHFSITLIGGDTILSTGGLTLSLTAFGEVRQGQALRRSGARPGDDLYVSGTLGDAALGLLAIEGRLEMIARSDRDYFVSRYRLPEPRSQLGMNLIGLANAAIDISDGLAADLAHMCDASRAGACVETKLLPLSPAASAALAGDGRLLTKILSGGDDYELLISACPGVGKKLVQAARASDTALARVGRITEEPGVRLIGSDGAEILLANAGYTHF